MFATAILTNAFATQGAAKSSWSELDKGLGEVRLRDGEKIAVYWPAVGVLYCGRVALGEQGAYSMTDKAAYVVWVTEVS